MPYASGDEHVHYYSVTTIRRFARTLLLIFSIVILVVPVVVLFYVHRMEIRLGLIAVFSFLFAAAFGLGTNSRNHEIFVALAALVNLFPPQSSWEY